MRNSVAKKLFAVGTALATVAGSLAPMAAHAAAHAAGTNIKSSDGTIWMVTSEGTRRAYTSAGAFLSYGFNSFASVVDANAEDLALTAGAFIPPQDGKIICSDRGTDKGTCYLITEGKKAGFTSAAVFTGLGFSFSRAQYGDVSWMSSTSNIDSTTAAHLPGVLINNGGTVQLRGTSSNLGIPDIATFNSWGYSFSDVVPANAADKAITQAGVMAARVAGQLSPSFTTTPGTGTPASAFSASLASTSPSASTLVAGSSVARLADFAISGNGTINSVTLKRIGVSADDTLANVYLFDGTTRITDAASVSSGNITFAGLNIPVNGTKVLSVRSDIKTNTSGQVIGIQMTMVNGGALATQPSGATHTIANATLATVTVNTPTAVGSTDATSDVRVWESNFDVNTRDVTMTRLALRQIESIPSGDIKNFRLLVDGVQVASQMYLDSNSYVTFAGFSKTLTTGTRNVKVMADITGGSSRNVKMSLRNKADIELMDSQYNVNITASGTFPAQPASATTVNTGSVSTSKATNSPSGTVTKDASNVVLGRWTLTAYGEAVKVETLNFAVDTSYATDTDVTLRNGKVMIAGAQYGSTTGLTAEDFTSTTEVGVPFTVNYTIQPGTPVTVELVADMYDEEGTNNLTNGITIQAEMVQGNANGTKQASLNTVNVPSGNVLANSVAVGVGTLTFAKDPTYGTQTIVTPRTAYKIADFNLGGNSTEDVNIHTITADIAVTDSSGTEATIADVTDVYVKYGTQTSSIKPTVAATGNTWSVSLSVPKNGIVPVEVYANLSSDFASGDSVVASVQVSGITANSNTTVVTDGDTGTAGNQVTAGQTISLGSASLKVDKDSSSPDARIVSDEQTVTGAAFKFTATNDTYKISEVTITIADGATTVGMVNLKDGSTVLQSKPGSATVTFSGLSIPVTTTKVLTVELQLGSVGTGSGLTGSSALVTLTSAKAISDATGVEADVTEVVSNPAGNALYVYESTPSFTREALPSGEQLTNGTHTLAKFTVTANGGDIAWKELTFAVTKDTGTTLANLALYDASNNTIAGEATSTIVAGDTSGTIVFTATSEETISTSKTYVLKGTIGGAAAVGDYVTVQIARPSAHAASNDYTTVAATGATFVWSDIATSHDYAATSDDWSNDNLVGGLPTDTWTLNFPN